MTVISLPVSDNDVTNKFYFNDCLEKAISNFNTYINDIMAKFEQNVYRSALLIDGTTVPNSSIDLSSYRKSSMSNMIRQQDENHQKYVDQAIACKTIFTV